MTTPEAPPIPFPHPAGPLSGYRVIDLADEKGQLCARLLAEMGADVIKVEPRDGDPARHHGPFFRGEEGKDNSLFWWAMNAGKRSVTAELRLEPGREIVRKLIAGADMLIETFKPGEAGTMGFDYAHTGTLNPGLIHVSITNFGLTGPYKDLEATDIVASAMGGHMYLNGDDERGPVRTTAPQAWAQVNFQALTGALIALYARGVNDGVGQHVDVSMQEAMANAMDNAQATWDIRKVNVRGPGIRRMASGVPGPRYLFEASDGWLAALQVGGLIGPRAASVIDWLAEAGEARGLDTPEWRARLTAAVPLSQEDRAYVEDTLMQFTRTRKKEELVAEAQRRGQGWAPVFGPREIVESKQLAGREYWIRVQHEDLGESFIYPGAPWKASETPWQQRGRAPHIGEHNAQVYAELGFDESELRRLKLRMVI